MWSLLFRTLCINKDSLLINLCQDLRSKDAPTLLECFRGAHIIWCSKLTGVGEMAQ